MWHIHLFIKCIILSILLVSSAVSVQAQTVYGFRIGANFATLNGDFGEAAEPESYTGLIAGSFTRFALRRGLGVQVEVLYSQKGARFEREIAGVPVEQTLLATYLEIPVLLTYTVPIAYRNAPLLYAGPALGFEIREYTRQSTGELEQTESSDVLTSPDLGLMVGVDVPISLGALDALLGLRYTYGLRDLVNRDTATRPESEAFTRTFAATVGFLF